MFNKWFISQHTYLLNSSVLNEEEKRNFRFYSFNHKMNSSKLKESLLFLTKALHKHFHKKVFVLIDDQLAMLCTKRMLI